MKKIATITIMLLVAAMTAGAQDGRWEKRAVEGDELKGVEPTTSYVYVQKGMGGFVFWQNNDSRFCIVSPKVMFNTTVSNGDTGTLAAIIGYLPLTGITIRLSSTTRRISRRFWKPSSKAMDMSGF